MLKPSCSEIMDVLNKEFDFDNKITSPYAIVIATAKRARQLTDGMEPYTTAHTLKPVSISVNELYNGFVRILPDTFSDAASIMAPIGIAATAVPHIRTEGIFSPDDSEFENAFDDDRDEYDDEEFEDSGFEDDFGEDEEALNDNEDLFDDEMEVAFEVEFGDEDIDEPYDDRDDY